MRLDELRLKNVQPVQRFEVADLSDLVVVAGPNGVGKTRMIRRVADYMRGANVAADVGGIVEATCADEREAWGKSKLELGSAEDVALLRATLQRTRRRRNWRSSLVNFESDRTIQNLQPFQFSWDVPDPEDEEVDWGSTLGFMRDRYQDTVHSMFKLIEAQKQRIAARAIQLRRDGKDSMNLEFSDPMQEFKELFARLLPGKELEDPSSRVQKLRFRAGGQTYDFEALSSGEREVVNIAFDFQLRKPQDCIVLFDEPELHLHPELSYRLIQTLQDIGERNQFILTTHAPDVISSALDHSVIFLTPAQQEPDGTPRNQATVASQGDDTYEALRLIGQSIGIIALGRRLVLIEGERSSLDKQLYGAILGTEHRDLVLVPTGGRHAIQSFDLVRTKILERTLWGVDFFMLCDGDSAPPGGQSERLRILPRYHIENFFLDAHVWATAMKTLDADGDSTDPEHLDGLIRTIAGEFTSYAVALKVAAQLRLEVGNVDIMPSQAHGLSADELGNKLASECAAEAVRLNAALDADRVREAAHSMHASLTESLSVGDDRWTQLIPAKPLLGKLSSRLELHEGRAKKLYLDAVSRSGRDPFAEIRAIFAEFAAI